MKVHEALTEVMRSVSAVGKTGRNTEQNYNFRGVDAVVNAVGPALREHGVVVLPSVEHLDYSTVEVGRNRTRMGQATVTVRYTFYGPEGDSLDAVSVGEAFDTGDKATPKAMSVAFRTVLLQGLCLPTDERDPDADSYARSERDPAREARDELLAFVRSAGLEPPAVAQDFYAEYAISIQEADEQQLRDSLKKLREAQ